MGCWSKGFRIRLCASMQPSCLLCSQPALPVACKRQRWPAQSAAISSLSWCLLGWCRGPKRTRREDQGPLAVALSPSLGHSIVQHLMCLSDAYLCPTPQHGLLWLRHHRHGLTLQHIEQSLCHVWSFHLTKLYKTPFPFGQAGHTCCLGEATATSIIAVGTQARAQQNATESQAKPICIDLQCQDPVDKLSPNILQV